MRALTLWRTWDDHDMALSDRYFATKQAAVAHLVADYDVAASALRLDSIIQDVWSAAMPPDVAGSTVYLERIRVEPTREGIAHALTHIPHR